MPFLPCALYFSLHWNLSISKLTCVTCTVLATSIFSSYTDSPAYTHIVCTIITTVTLADITNNFHVAKLSFLNL